MKAVGLALVVGFFSLVAAPAQAECDISDPNCFPRSEPAPVEVACIAGVDCFSAPGTAVAQVPAQVLPEAVQVACVVDVECVSNVQNVAFESCDMQDLSCYPVAAKQSGNVEVGLGSVASGSRSRSA